MPNASAWLTNVGKSLGMASMDVLKDIMPATTQMIQSGAEYASEFQQHMGQIRSQGGRLKQIMDKNVYKDILIHDLF